MRVSTQDCDKVIAESGQELLLVLENAWIGVFLKSHDCTKPLIRFKQFLLGTDDLLLRSKNLFPDIQIILLNSKLQIFLALKWFWIVRNRPPVREESFRYAARLILFGL